MVDKNTGMQKKKMEKQKVEKENIAEQASPDEIDLRTISIEDAEREAMEALGIKPHKKPALLKPDKGTTKPRKKEKIKDDETSDFHIHIVDDSDEAIHIVDDSDEALAEALKVFDEEASKLNANPMFNSRLMTAAMKIGYIYLQQRINDYLENMKKHK